LIHSNGKKKRVKGEKMTRNDERHTFHLGAKGCSFWKDEELRGDIYNFCLQIEYL
jgi:hypothetical protein